MLTCPHCQKTLQDLARQCPRCRTDLTLLVDYSENLETGLERAERLVRSGELGEAVWEYLQVLEVDPDNPTASRQVSQVVTAVRQFDRISPAGMDGQDAPGRAFPPLGRCHAAQRRFPALARFGPGAHLGAGRRHGRFLDRLRNDPADILRPPRLRIRDFAAMSSSSKRVKSSNELRVRFSRCLRVCRTRASCVAGRLRRTAVGPGFRWGAQAGTAFVQRSTLTRREWAGRNKSL